MDTPFPLDRPLEEGVDFTEIPTSNPDGLARIAEEASPSASVGG